MNWQPGPTRAQAPLATEPYDRWIAPEDECKAEFHRTSDGYLVRFPQEADFLISGPDYAIAGWPAPESDAGKARSLYNNAITPILGNHRGGLFLHGSAVLVDGQAIAFLGQSRSGKTTLAGSFAKAGFPFMTEDVIDVDLTQRPFALRPKPSALRLFKDSADFLFDNTVDYPEEDQKQDVAPTDALPFADEPAPLKAIFLLGSDQESDLKIERLGAQAALSTLMPHSFILDVEDKPKLRGHFGRLADLSQRVPCYTLDYPRIYSQLPDVLRTVIETCRGAPEADGNG